MTNWTIDSGNAAGVFAINSVSGEISIANITNLNYDTNNSYTLGVTVSDGTNTSVIRTVTIGVTDVNNNAPVIAAGQSFSASEAVSNGTALGTLAASDGDSGTAFSNWTITAGNADGAFVLDAGTGLLSVADGSKLDFETATSRSISVTVSDGTNTSASQTVSIAVTDFDEFDVSAVTDIDTAINTVIETSATGTTVGISASAIDADGTTNTITYSLDNNAGGRFGIDGSTGVVSVANSNLLDHESAISHSITVRATSADGSSQTEVFVIAIENANEFGIGTVSDADGSTNSVAENSVIGTLVGITALATDADTPDTVTYSLSVNPGNNFAIDAITGVVTTNAVLDRETASSHSLTILATSSDGSTQSKAFNIAVLDQNDNAPIVTAGQAFAISEFATNGDIVGIIIATDADETILASNWTIVNGNSAGIFTIDSSTGQITVTKDPTLNFETTQSYMLEVQANDGVNAAVAEKVTINVTNEDDPPTISAIADVDAAEDSLAGPFAFSVADVDSSLTALTVTAASNDQSLVRNSDITITGTGANRFINFKPAADATGGPTTITVQVSDGNSTASTTFDVQITPVNDAPLLSAVADQAIDEDEVSPRINFTVSDIDNANADLVVTAISSDQSLIADSSIVLTGTGPNRRIRFTPEANANGGPATITLTVSDGKLTSSQTFDVTVLPVNDAPTMAVIPNATTDEDTPIGPFTFSVGDLESAATDLTITATSSDQNILPDGKITLGGTAEDRTISVAPNSNAFGTVDITVTISDGDATSQQTFRLTVDPVNDAPQLSAVADQTVNEDQASPQIELTVDDIDNNATDLVVTAISSDQSLIADSSIVLTGTGPNRRIRFTPEANANGGPATITLTVSDGKLTSSQTFDVTVLPVNDAPTMAVIPNATTDEDTPIGPFTFSVGDLESAATDLTITATSSDQNILPDGKITLGGTAEDRTISVAPNSNAFGTVDITVTISDGDATSQQTFRLTVDPVNDAPTISNIADLTILEDTNSGPIAVTVQDVDNLNRSLVVTVASNNQGLIANNNVIVTGTGRNRQISFNPAKDAFGGPVTLLVSVTDGELVTQTSFVVNVTPVNDAPAFAPGTDLTFVVKDNFTFDSSAPGVLKGVTDVEDDAFTAVLVSGPTHGSLTLKPDGSFTYVANVDYSGIDTFQFYLTDGKTNSAPATARMKIPVVVPIGVQSAGQASSQTPVESATESVTETTSESKSESDTAQQEAQPILAATASTMQNESKGDSEDEDYMPILTPQGEDDDSDERGYSIVTTDDTRDEFNFIYNDDIGSVDANRVQTSLLDADANSASNFESNVAVPSSAIAPMIFTTASYQDFADVKNAVDQVAQLRETLDTRIDMSKMAIDAVATVSMSVFAGSVFTAVRTGVLALGFLTQLPVWTMFDPLMVMDGVGGDEGDSLEEIVDRNAKATENKTDDSAE